MKYSIIIFLLILSINSFSQNDCAKVDMNYSGYCIEYYSSGITKWIKEFEEGQAVGIWMNFDEKGNLVKQLNTSLKNDSLRKTFVEQGQENIVTNQLKKNILQDTIYCFGCEPEASYPGGSDALRNFIVKNVIYPKRALDLGIEGRVYVKFIVEKDGTLSNICIQRGIVDCPECDEEILRVMHLMPKWIAPKEGGKAIRTNMSLPFNFNLH